MAGQRDFNLQEINYPAGPFGRGGHRMVSHGEDIYVWGGMNLDVPDDDPIYANDPVWAQTNPFFQEMWKFSYVSQRWQLLETHGQIPQHLAAFGMCIIGDIIFVYGGTRAPFGVNNSNRLYSFDIHTRVWTLMPNQLVNNVPAVQPNPLFYQSVIGRTATIIEHGIQYNTGFVYVFGGANRIPNMPQEYDNNLYEYSLRTTLWTRLETEPFGPPQVAQLWPLIPQTHPPEPRYKAELAYYNDRIYILGGRTDQTIYRFDMIKTYHLISRDWITFLTTRDIDDSDVNNIIDNGYPQRRTAFACAQYRHEVFIIGGTNNDEILDDIWKLDLVTLRWKLICQMPNPVMVHSASVSNEGILSIFGGMSLDDLDDIVTTRRLLRMNLRVQTLADTAFVSASHYGYHKELYQLKALFPEKFE